MNEMSIQAKFKDTFIEWCQSSTAHAIPNIARNKNKYIKIFWLICFLTSSSYCCYSLVESLLDFLEYKTSISTETFQEMPSIFPAVSICSLNSFDSKKAADLIKTTLNNLNGSTFSKVNPNRPIDFVLANKIFSQASLTNNMNLTSQRRQFGYELHESILGCWFGYEMCSKNDFAWFYDNVYGNCYTFNKGILDNHSTTDLLKVSTSGVDFGLQLELFMGKPKDQLLTEYNIGAIVLVHNQTKTPVLSSRRIMVTTGFETDVAITRHFISKLDFPYSNCVKDVSKASGISPVLVDHILDKLNASYDQEYCFLLCLQKMIIDECNCTNGKLPPYGDQPMCLTSSKISCMFKTVQDFSNRSLRDECLVYCPLECDSVEYDVSTSIARYPNYYYKTLLAQHLAINGSGIEFEDINNAVLKVNVFYRTLKYQVTTEIPSITNEQFFSNVGGILGLYLGISVLSIIEVFELIAQLFEIFFKTKNKVNNI